MIYDGHGKGDLADPTASNSKPRSVQGSTLSITAIIPAYNEGGRIGKVLGVLRQVPQLNEIIVVDDGSCDTTIDETRQAGLFDKRIRVISHEVNRGKGQSIFTAWQVTKTKYILLLDADLIGLTPELVIDLITPVTQGKADMTVGLFRKGSLRTDLGHWATPWLTGQRCLIADLLDDVSYQAAEGYGIETALTVAAKRYDWRVKPVQLMSVTHIPSEAHRGFWRGVKIRTRMYLQVVRAWYIASGGGQISTRLRDWIG